MAVNKIKSTSVVDQVIESITQSLINKELRPGDRIPPETELAEQLGVSRNTVREAVKTLVSWGVLEIRRPEGTFVLTGLSEPMINPMLYGVILNQGDSYDSLMEIREMIEVGVMRLAIEKATPQEIESLRAPLKCMKEESQSKDELITRVYNAFHDAIDEICDNLVVSKINSITRTLTYKLRYETVSKMILSGQGEKFYKAHERIFEILKNKESIGLNESIRETYFLTEIINKD